MSKQSKLAAWQSPVPDFNKVVKLEPKVTKISQALEVPVIEVPVVATIPDAIIESVEVTKFKPEIKKLKKVE